MGGLASLADVLVSVDTLRILSASAGPAWRGDTIAASLGVDNIQGAGFTCTGVNFCSGCFITLFSSPEKAAAYHAVPDIEAFKKDLRSALD